MFAILCDAREGRDMGIRVLALVDRSKERRLWWTSDNPSIVRAYDSREEAQDACNKLGRNNPRVVSFDKMKRKIVAQTQEIAEAEREHENRQVMDDAEMGWDAHKDYSFS
jgi:hypothetical protein